MTSALIIRDPAVAIAIGRCLTARSLGFPKRAIAAHETECGWEPYPTEVLKGAVEEFRRWADFDDRHSTSGRHETRVFTELPRDRQRELIEAAQAFEPSTPREPDAPLPPASVEEEIVPWLR